MRGSRSSTSKWVIARRARSLRVGHHRAPRRGRGRSARRWCRARRRGGPATSARYSRRISRAAHHRLERAVGLLGAGHHEQPEVSRSSRWTMPGALGMLAAGGAAGERLGERAGRMARRRVGHEPRRLVHDQQVLVLEARPRARRRRPDPRRPPAESGSAATRTRSPSARRWCFGRARPSTVTAPRLDQALRRRARARRAAGGQEGVEPQAGVLRRRRQELARPSLPPLHHVEQQQHPDHDRRVGQVERGPRDGIDEVDHGPLAGAVGEVAERAAEQQPTGSQSHGMSRCTRK